MIWYVALGSAVGGAARYAVSTYFQRGAFGLPAGTLVVNVSGSFLLALLLRVALESPGFNPELRLALTAGFCGGFTTFSTFSYETLVLLEQGDWRRAAAYVGLSVGGSLLGAALGLLLARELILSRNG